MTQTQATTKTTTKAAQAAKTTKPDPKPNACVCGCGKRVRHLFAQGHDQRVRGILQRNAGDAKRYPIPETLAEAIRKGLVKHLQRVGSNARILTAKAA